MLRHWFLVNVPEGDRLRYKVMRRARPDEAFFFMRRTGSEIGIRAMESLQIATKRPNANIRAQRAKLSCSLTAPKCRGRPPKYVSINIYQIFNYDPFDLQVASDVFDVVAQRIWISWIPCQSFHGLPTRWNNINNWLLPINLVQFICSTLHWLHYLYFGYP